LFGWRLGGCLASAAVPDFCLRLNPFHGRNLRDWERVHWYPPHVFLEKFLTYLQSGRCAAFHPRPAAREPVRQQPKTAREPPRKTLPTSSLRARSPAGHHPRREPVMGQQLLIRGPLIRDSGVGEPPITPWDRETEAKEPVGRPQKRKRRLYEEVPDSQPSIFVDPPCRIAPLGPCIRVRLHQMLKLKTILKLFSPTSSMKCLSMKAWMTMHTPEHFHLETELLELYRPRRFSPKK